MVDSDNVGAQNAAKHIEDLNEHDDDLTLALQLRSTCLLLTYRKIEQTCKLKEIFLGFFLNKFRQIVATEILNIAVH